MIDTPSIWPDNWYVEANIKPKSHYERVLWKDYPVQSKEVWGVIVKVKDRVTTIVINKGKIRWETNDKTGELKEKLTKKVEVILTPEEIEAVWWKIFAFFQWKQLVRYEIWESLMIDVAHLDINNEFGNLLSKKVSNSYFERLPDWLIIWHKMNWKILNQNENIFHRSFYMEFSRLKRPISK